MIAIGALLLIGCILLFFLAQSATSSFRKLFEGNSLLSRLFISNRFAAPALTIFQDLLNAKYSFFKLFGAAVDVFSFDPYYPPNGVVQIVSGIWLFDNIITSGLFGAIFFLVTLVLGIRRMFMYIGRYNEEDSVKYTIAGYVLGFLVISLLLLDVRPLVNSDRLFPFFTSAPLLIVIFLLSYTFNRSLTLPAVKKNKKAEEPVKEEKEGEEDEEILVL